jgi:hypothetical protein
MLDAGFWILDIQFPVPFRDLLEDFRAGCFSIWRINEHRQAASVWAGV